MERFQSQNRGREFGQVRGFTEKVGDESLSDHG